MKGLVRKSNAPPLVACTALSIEPYAVIMMTTASGSMRKDFRQERRQSALAGQHEIEQDHVEDATPERCSSPSSAVAARVTR